jgi:hypothetical protein
VTYSASPSSTRLGHEREQSRPVTFRRRQTESIEVLRSRYHTDHLCTPITGSFHSTTVGSANSGVVSRRYPGQSWLQLAVEIKSSLASRFFLRETRPRPSEASRVSLSGDEC